jgi:hypothetical protein
VAVAFASLLMVLYIAALAALSAAGRPHHGRRRADSRPSDVLAVFVVIRIPLNANFMASA